jgi:hypothetical protein
MSFGMSPWEESWRWAEHHPWAFGSSFPASPEFSTLTPPWEWPWQQLSSWEEMPWDEQRLWNALEDVSYAIAIDLVTSPSPSGGEYFVGWSQPPHPIDWIPSVNPKASHREQARAVLYDYFHDDHLRTWAGNDYVRKAFGTKDKPIQNTADYDPVLLVAAYEDKNHAVWKTGSGPGYPKDGWTTQTRKGKPGKGVPVVSWDALDDAVQLAIDKRLKLGPLPQSSYVTHPGPVYIYYYDNDWMKKIVYPSIDIPDALKPDNKRWWSGGGIGTHQSNDPKQIEAERKNPGVPGGGNWGDEGFDFQKDLGAVGEVFGIIMEAVGTVLQVIPGVGTAIGTALIVGGAVIQSITAAIGDAMIGADNAAALAGLAQAVLKAVGISGIQIPPEYAKMLSTTVNTIAQTVSEAQKKNLSFSQMWDTVAAQAQSLGPMGDKEAHTLAVILGENEAGNLFIKGHTVGKFAKMEQIEAIAEIVKGFSIFVKDPKALNLFLLGAGLGHLTAVQEGKKPPLIPSADANRASPQITAARTRASTASAQRAGVHRVGAIAQASAHSAREDLDHFLDQLEDRYALGAHLVGQDQPPVVWDPLAWGCPPNTWKDPLSGHCIAKTPVCGPGFRFDMNTGRCMPISPGMGGGW